MSPHRADSTIKLETVCGNERSIPLNPQLGLVMQQYERARGASSPTAPFFRSRFGGPLLVRSSVGLVTIRDLLGHRQITSTQIYLHVTAEDLRAAAARHPIGSLLSTVKHLLPVGRLPFQRPRPFDNTT
jgi:integrase